MHTDVYINWSPVPPLLKPDQRPWLSFGAILRINTVVILFGDVIRGNPWVVLEEMEGCKV